MLGFKQQIVSNMGSAVLYFYPAVDYFHLAVLYFHATVL